MTGPRILVVEDDPGLRSVIRRGLEEEGFDAAEAATGGEALERAQGVAAMVIDIGLPDADGRDVCQTLRARGVRAPVLFLTARDALTDRLSGFSAGGDDYVTKPFSLIEVAARLRAMLARSGVENATTAAGLQLDPSEHQVACGPHAVSLTPTEFRLLGALAARTGEAVSRRDLTRAAWPEGAVVYDNTLDVYVARLRRKLRSLDGAPALHTVHGVGYRLQ